MFAGCGTFSFHFQSCFISALNMNDTISLPGRLLGVGGRVVNKAAEFLSFLKH